MYKTQLIFMTPPLMQSGVGSPSLYYRCGVLRQRCTVRPHAGTSLHICVYRSTAQCRWK